MEKTEKLAKYLFEIHSKQLFPFYDADITNSWDKLLEFSVCEKDVDKSFFRTIAKDFIKQHSKEKHFESKLPQLLYEIHANSLPPYYMSYADYQLYHSDVEDDRYYNNWTTLAEETNYKDLVDKTFFTKLAEYILKQLDK